MARNEYYTYKDSPINGDIMMSVQVFDIITKQVGLLKIRILSLIHQKVFL